MTRLPQAYLNNCEEGFEVSGMIIRPKSEGKLDSMDAWGDSSRQFEACKASPGVEVTRQRN